MKAEIAKIIINSDNLKDSGVAWTPLENDRVNILFRVKAKESSTKYSEPGKTIYQYLKEQDDSLIG